MRVYFYLFLMASIGGMFFFYRNHSDQPPAPKYQYVIKQKDQTVSFNLVDPEQAPIEIREQVLYGYKLILNTPFYAPKYARDQLSCNHCHFSGGNTLGGRNEGISLVGVPAIYPQYSERSQATITLEERINNCFQRSLNGNPLPEGSKEMASIVQYLDWISSEVKGVKNPPWLGLKLLKSQHKPDQENGEIIYQSYCAACHRDNGSGGGVLPEPEGRTIPPIWGNQSFNEGAGMNTLPMLASFIYWNMPYQNSILTEEQALDVAEFIIKQQRPKFE